MTKVLTRGTGIATFAYILCGIGGYVTFSLHPDGKAIMEKQNILLADYGGAQIIKVCLLLLLAVVLFASPFCVLPSKDSFEELLMKDGVKFSAN